MADTTTTPKPCPFCGSEDIRFSVRVTGRFKVMYQVATYCGDCYAYGPRTLTLKTEPSNYKKRRELKTDEEAMQRAIEAWNRRVNDG